MVIAFIVLLCKVWIVTPLCMGWMYVWVIGDRKVIDDVCIKSCYSFRKYFCRLCLCLTGAWAQSWELNQYTSAYQRIQLVLRGSMTNIMYVRGGDWPFAFDVKGGEWLGVVVSIKSKGRDCWHYDTGIVLDGNSLRWKITVQQVNSKELHISLHRMKKERYT